jgi:serine/threonine protein kinase, bacterial
MQETVQQPDPPTQICPSCGAALRGAVAFCPSCGFALRAMTGRLQTAQVLAARYRIVRLVARGGMGAVYQAEDTRLGGAPVAVKEMASSFVRGDTEAFERAVADFRREAAMLARLRHPHLPRVSDQFDEQGKHYLVMEFIAGHTLLDELRRAGGRLSLEQALDYADQLCDVLAYLHNQNPPIIYRDLKPSNVMVVSEDGRSAVDDGGQQAPSTVDRRPSPQLVLIDFGIARFYRPGQAGDTAIYGTTGYAPPEQYGRGQTDARTDIYALGVLLHQMLTGHDPTTTPFALPPPRAVNPAIPQHVASAIARATAADREARFADIGSFRAALRAPDPAARAVRRGAAETAHANRSGAPAAPQLRRSGLRLLWAIVGLATLLLIAALVFALGLWPPRRTISSAPPAVVTQISPPGESNRPPRSTAAPAQTPGNVTPAVNTGSDSVTPRATATGANAVLLRPSDVSASSTAAPGLDAQQNPVRYDPQNAVDGRPDTTWRVAGDGVGQWLQLVFASEASVTSIGLIPGYDKVDPIDGTDRFFQNRIVKLARFEFSDGTVVRASFSRDRTMQIVPVGGVRTRSVRIVIEETYPPPPTDQGGRDFTPISEVQVQGTP